MEALGPNEESWVDVGRPKLRPYPVFGHRTVGLCVVLSSPNIFNSVFGREFLVGASRGEVAADPAPDAHGAVVRTLALLCATLISGTTFMITRTAPARSSISLTKRPKQTFL
jgi:hypothetical protein